MEVYFVQFFAVGFEPTKKNTKQIDYFVFSFG